MDGSAPQIETEERTKVFLDELTKLSTKHGIGITEGAVLFVLEKEDYDSRYRIDHESNLSLV